MLTKEEVMFEAPPMTLPISAMKNGVKLATVRNNLSEAIIKTSTKGMAPNGSCIKYVCSRVTLYYNSRIELKWRRSLHHCQTCEYGDTKDEACGAIHYGMCLPVVSSSSVVGKPENRVSRTAAVPGHGSFDTHRPVAKPAGNNVTTSHPSSQSVTVYPQTIANGAITKDKEILPRDRDSVSEKDQEKENTNLNINQQNNNFTQNFNKDKTSTNKENRAKRKDTSKQIKGSERLNAANIPKFHYPLGQPPEKDASEEVLLRVSQEFSRFEDGKVFRNQMGGIAKATGVPLYWKCPLFIASGGIKEGYITYQMFSSMWKRVSQTHFDRASLFLTLLAKPGTNYLEEEDLIPLLQDVVDTHPGLTFLLEAPEFHSRYVNTVIARIFYCVNRSWTSKITIPELRKSNFLQVLQLLEEEDDINQIMDYFSYEHFYVIYCKFWELDRDHDLFIDRTDLGRHNEHAISSRMIDRVFSGAVTRGKTFEEGKMSYPEFVWFLLSEEDKKHPTSVEYWFRCMDLDGDGVISMYEMEFFYEEQMQKMEALGIERLPFEDCLCQMIDLVQPSQQFNITLKDLKRCKMTNIFFDTFMNLDKFLEHEQRDPFANLRDLESDTPEPTDWEKYAAEEYEILVAEEGANEQEEIHYEDDFEPDDDEPLPDDLSMAMGEPRPSDPIQRSTLGSGGQKKVHSINQDDMYDFSNSGSTY